MPALQHVGNLANRAGVSPLKGSPMWHQAVETITAAQLYAFVTRLKEQGRRDEAETAIDIAQDEIQKAVARNELAVPQMLAYQNLQHQHLTAGELRDGLAFIGQPEASAILFALETGMSNLDVTSLTYQSLLTYRRRHTLTPLAEDCVRSRPRHLLSEYVFWQDVGGRPSPIFGLDERIFSVFGMIWPELVWAYRHLIMVDGAADSHAFITLCAH